MAKLDEDCLSHAHGKYTAPSVGCFHATVRPPSRPGADDDADDDAQCYRRVSSVTLCSLGRILARHLSLAPPACLHIKLKVDRKQPVDSLLRDPPVALTFVSSALGNPLVVNPRNETSTV